MKCERVVIRLAVIVLALSAWTPLSLTMLIAALITSSFVFFTFGGMVVSVK